MTLKKALPFHAALLHLHHAASAASTTLSVLSASEMAKDSYDPNANWKSLQKAQNLQVPTAMDILNAEYEHDEFWEEVGPLVKDAWIEWEEYLMEQRVLGQKDQFLGSVGEVEGTDEKVHDLGDVVETTSSNEDISVDEEWMKWLHPTLAHSLKKSFEFPSSETEAAVRSHWNPPLSNPEDARDLPPTPSAALPEGVYSIPQLLTPTSLRTFRNLLDLARSSQIPARRPNGMNRNGIIIDPNHSVLDSSGSAIGRGGKVNGAVSFAPLVKIVELLVEKVARPVGRMLFPKYVGCDDDVEYFAFTIQYDGEDNDGSDGVSGDVGEGREGVCRDANSGTSAEAENDVGKVIIQKECIHSENLSSSPPKDVELKEHRDASVITLNINLNLPDEDYAGSEVYFRDFPHSTNSTDSQGDNSGGVVSFSPGMALIHLGAHRHGSLPISKVNSKGKRYNLVIWLFGNDGDVRIAPYSEEEQMGVMERWHGCKKSEDFVDFLL